MALLLYGNSVHCADMLYFCGFFIPDTALALQVGKKKIGIFSALEYNRALKESSLDEVLSLETTLAEAAKVFRKKQATLVDVVRLLAKNHDISNFHIAKDFPAGLAFKLKKAKVKIEVAEGPLLPQREVKSPEEAKKIREGNAAIEKAFKVAENALKKATIKNNKLYLDRKILTSERLRTLINISCLESGTIPNDTIVAGGNQACDPHCTGTGPLRPHELIIIDIFPRVTKTGYHGDMTRTFLKGKASEIQKKLVNTVLEAQKKALTLIKAETSSKKVHKAVQDYFKTKGFKTQKVNGHHQGFFHGTGHGLGLEVHESPRVGSASSARLKSGAVITVEPGLYYPDLGACRIEDVVWIQPKGYKMLSHYHYSWQFR